MFSQMSDSIQGGGVSWGKERVQSVHTPCPPPPQLGPWSVSRGEEHKDSGGGSCVLAVREGWHT